MSLLSVMGQANLIDLICVYSCKPPLYIKKPLFQTRGRCYKSCFGGTG